MVNGDIIDEITAREALIQSGADGVMVGRAANRSPLVAWRNCSSAEVGQRHKGAFTGDPTGCGATPLCETIAHYGVPLGVRMARKHLAAYVDLAAVDVDPVQRRALRGSICRLSSPARVTEALGLFFDNDPMAAARLAA